jgi:hypothetical protein
MCPHSTHASKPTTAAAEPTAAALPAASEPTAALSAAAEPASASQSAAVTEPAAVFHSFVAYAATTEAAAFAMGIYLRDIVRWHSECTTRARRTSGSSSDVTQPSRILDVFQ